VRVGTTHDRLRGLVVRKELDTSLEATLEGSHQSFVTPIHGVYFQLLAIISSTS
jgi:hypothetical protein